MELLSLVLVFENYVNYAGSKTLDLESLQHEQFENYVNYAGSKTSSAVIMSPTLFENYVNYAGSKTINQMKYGG